MTRLLAGSLTALVWLGACATDDAMDTNAGTETSTDTGSTSTESGDGDGDGECVPPPGVFGDCGPGTAACMTDGPKLCVVDNQNSPSIAVCGRRCTDTCDCWAPPPDGDAEVACSSLIPGDEGVCVLDCSGGKACPSGMLCTDEVGLEVCVFQQ